MKMTRRSLLGLFASLPFVRRASAAMLEAQPVTPHATGSVMIVRSCGQLVPAHDLMISSELSRSDETGTASFTTNDMGARCGEELRVYFDGACIFSGHIIRRDIIRPPFDGAPYQQVHATNNWLKSR